MSRVALCRTPVPLGKNCRMRPLVFSFVPRSHGEPGCAKYTVIPVSMVNCLCSLISFPWSYVSVFARSRGSERSALAYSFRTGFGILRFQGHEHRVARRASDERTERRSLVLAHDEIALPVAGYVAGGDLGGRSSIEHVGDLASRFLALFGPCISSASMPALAADP